MKSARHVDDARDWRGSTHEIGLSGPIRRVASHGGCSCRRGREGREHRRMREDDVDQLRRRRGLERGELPLQLTEVEPEVAARRVVECV